MSQSGNTKSRDDAERKCFVTGEVQPKSGLIRFAISPDGVVVPDISEKLPGRGAWLTSDHDVLKKADSKGFARVFRQPARIEVDLPTQVEQLLTQRTISLIALARKAGLTVSGFERVKAWLSGGQSIRGLFQASDGSARGKGKLWTPEGARYFDCLTADELGQAFGKQTVVHCALASGRLSDRVVEDATRLKGLREKGAGNGRPERNKE